jgi:hypothetical protein
MIVIRTQYQENYGAHDWDGTGLCPQYWKPKGGYEYKVTGLPVQVSGALLVRLVALMTQRVESVSDYCIESVTDWSVEDDGYLSRFERDQLEYEGKIIHREKTVDWSDLVAIACD